MLDMVYLVGLRLNIWDMEDGKGWLWHRKENL